MITDVASLASFASTQATHRADSLIRALLPDYAITLGEDQSALRHALQPET